MIKDTDDIFIPRETVAETPGAIESTKKGETSGVYVKIGAEEWRMGNVIRDEKERVVIEYKTNEKDRISKIRIVRKELFETWQQQAPQK